VNVSDLAAKGAEPVGFLLGLALPQPAGLLRTGLRLVLRAAAPTSTAPAPAATRLLLALQGELVVPLGVQVVGAHEQRLLVQLQRHVELRPSAVALRRETAVERREAEVEVPTPAQLGLRRTARLVERRAGELDGVEREERGAEVVARHRRAAAHAVLVDGQRHGHVDRAEDRGRDDQRQGDEQRQRRDRVDHPEHGQDRVGRPTGPKHQVSQGDRDHQGGQDGDDRQQRVLTQQRRDVGAVERVAAEPGPVEVHRT